jgi:osmotically-inducible protein OsmY
MKIIISLIALVFALSGCFPAIFATAGSTTVALSQDRSFGGAIDDNAIWVKLQKEFAKEDFKELFARIDVKVDQGRVLLTGFTKTEESALKAVEICWEQKGIKEVVNELQVDPENAKVNPLRYAKDTWISGQVKGKVFLDKSIKYVNYTIVTFDSVIYLFGIARSEEELEKVANIASKVKGVDRVVSHVKIL